MSSRRQTAVGIGGVATLLLVLLVNPWFEVDGTLRSLVTIAFWCSLSRSSWCSISRVRRLASTTSRSGAPHSPSSCSTTHARA